MCAPVHDWKGDSHRGCKGAGRSCGQLRHSPTRNSGRWWGHPRNCALTITKGLTHWLGIIRPPHTSPPRASPPVPTALPYHLLGFGGLTAEGTGLPAGEVLGEVAIEHAEAAGVHLADRHLRLVPCAGRNRQGQSRGPPGETPVSPTSSPVTQTHSSASSLWDL